MDRFCLKKIYHTWVKVESGSLSYTETDPTNPIQNNLWKKCGKTIEKCCVIRSLIVFSTEADRLDEELVGIFLELLLSCTNKTIVQKSGGNLFNVENSLLH